MFNFEKLKVYKSSLGLADEIVKATTVWPTKYQFSIADQLRRAALSIPLNIAEGSGRTGIEFKRFIGISRSSVYECIPILKICVNNELISGKQYQFWYNQLVILAKQLSKLKSAI